MCAGQADQLKWAGQVLVAVFCTSSQARGLAASRAQKPAYHTKQADNWLCVCRTGARAQAGRAGARGWACSAPRRRAAINGATSNVHVVSHNHSPPSCCAGQAHKLERAGLALVAGRIPHLVAGQGPGQPGHCSASWAHCRHCNRHCGEYVTALLPQFVRSSISPAAPEVQDRDMAGCAVPERLAAGNTPATAVHARTLICLSAALPLSPACTPPHFIAGQRPGQLAHSPACNRSSPGGASCSAAVIPVHCCKETLWPARVLGSQTACCRHQRGVQGHASPAWLAVRMLRVHCRHKRRRTPAGHMLNPAAGAEATALAHECASSSVASCPLTLPSATCAADSAAYFRMQTLKQEEAALVGHTLAPAAESEAAVVACSTRAAQPCALLEATGWLLLTCQACVAGVGAGGGCGCGAHAAASSRSRGCSGCAHKAAAAQLQAHLTPDCCSLAKLMLQALEPEEAAVVGHTLTPAAEAEAAVVARMRQQQRSFVPTSAQLQSLPLQAGTLLFFPVGLCHGGRAISFAQGGSAPMRCSGVCILARQTWFVFPCCAVWDVAEPDLCWDQCCSSSYWVLLKIMSALQDGQNTIAFLFGRQRISAYLYSIAWDCRQAQ